jgi:predicted protein tyrosine phosphatase
MKRVLFVCSQNRLRSPTAEQLFASWEGIEVASAGLNNDAENVLTPELLGWADVIFVMEKAHRNKLGKKFRAHLSGKRIVCLPPCQNSCRLDRILILGVSKELMWLVWTSIQGSCASAVVAAGEREIGAGGPRRGRGGGHAGAVAF